MQRTLLVLELYYLNKMPRLTDITKILLTDVMALKEIRLHKRTHLFIENRIVRLDATIVNRRNMSIRQSF